LVLLPPKNMFTTVLHSPVPNKIFSFFMIGEFCNFRLVRYERKCNSSGSVSWLAWVLRCSASQFYQKSMYSNANYFMIMCNIVQIRYLTCHNSFFSSKAVFCIQICTKYKNNKCLWANSIK
jgi:hypothetical protein